MDKVYKLRLVNELPHQERKKKPSLRIGGFGLPEDDPIYQKVLSNLKEDNQSSNRNRPVDSDEDE